MKVIVDTASIKHSQSNLITGVIYLQFEDRTCFPDHIWFDFTLSVLYDWAYVLSNSTFGKVELSFWEGPYNVKISYDKNGVGTAKCYREGEIGEKLVCEGEFNLKYFVTSINDALTDIENCELVEKFKERVAKKTASIRLLMKSI